MFTSTGNPAAPDAEEGPATQDLATPQDGAVVGLGVLARLRGRSAVPGRESTSIGLSEFVEMESGRRIYLHDSCGCTTSAAVMSRASLRECCEGGVLPDETEPEHAAGEPHHWTWLALLASQHGLTVTPEHLRAVPYRYVYTDRLLECVDEDGEAGPTVR